MFKSTPKTSENFRKISTGANGQKASTGRLLFYAGSTYHRVLPGFMAQAGDFTAHNGTGGESVYGEFFDDEDLSGKFTERGLLAMANEGPNTNGSQFFINFVPLPNLDGKHVIFGKVSGGFDMLDEIEANADPSGQPL